MEYLGKLEDQVKKDLERERSSLNKVATRIYQLWQEISDLRQKQEFSFTNYDLKVHKGVDDKDVLFNLVSRGHHAGDYQWKIDRVKDSTTGTSCVCKLIFDGVCVGETPLKYVQYPNFEVDIFEQF